MIHSTATEGNRAAVLNNVLAQVPNTDDHNGVREYLHELADAGLSVLLINPGTKIPFDGRTHQQRKADDKAAQEQAKAEGRSDLHKVKSASGLALATTDKTVLDGYFDSYIRTHGEDSAVNVAVEVGASRLVVVDCDTAAQMAAFLTDAGLPDDTEPTVTSPGSQDKDGKWVHERGNGHWWYTVPEGVELPTNVGAMKVCDEDGGYAVLWDRRYVLTVPSVRPEGSYTFTGDVCELPEHLAQKITEHAQSRSQRAERSRSCGTGSDKITAYGASVTWAEILADTGWRNTGKPDGCGCDIWTAPGDHASPKSATTHEPGCGNPYFVDSPDPPMHFWTDHDAEPFGDYLEANGGTGNVTRLQAVAAIHFDNDMGAAMSELNLHNELPGFGSRTADSGDGNGNDGRPRLWRASEMKPARPMEWLAKGNLPKAAVTLLVGDEGIGKSTLWAWLVAHITTGKPCTEYGLPPRGPQDVVLVITEDDWSSTVSPRLEVAGADFDQLCVFCVDNDGSGSPTFPDHMDVLVASEVPPALVVVDAWLDTVPAGLTVRDPQQARQVLHPWKDYATITGAAVLLLTHTNRVATDNPRDKYGATAELRKTARHTLYAQADPDDDNCMIVGPEKGNNVARGCEATRFRITPVQHTPATEDSDGVVTKMEYVGPVGKSARALIAEVHRGNDNDADDNRIEEAVNWLEDFLTIKGITPSTEVKKAAEAAGIAKRTVERASLQLHVIKTSEGYPRTSHWEIPGGVQIGADGNPAAPWWTNSDSTPAA